MLIAGLFPLFDAVTSIFIILFLFVFSRALLFQKFVFEKNLRILMSGLFTPKGGIFFPKGGALIFVVTVN